MCDSVGKSPAWRGLDAAFPSHFVMNFLDSAKGRNRRRTAAPSGDEEDPDEARTPRHSSDAAPMSPEQGPLRQNVCSQAEAFFCFGSRDAPPPPRWYHLLHAGCTSQRNQRIHSSGLEIRIGGLLCGIYKVMRFTGLPYDALRPSDEIRPSEQSEGASDTPNLSKQWFRCCSIFG